MRSAADDLRASPCRRRALAAGLIVLLAAGAASAQSTASPSPPPADTASAPPLAPHGRVQAVAQELRRHPDLQDTRTIRTLKFRFEPEPRKRETQQPRMAWWIEFVRWMSETGRWLVWLVGAGLVAWLAVSLRRWIRERAEPAGGAAAALPSFVRQLDIRPQSLPDDIGGAAAALWQTGEHRAALSLLYRGALSRLVHEFTVPIRAASTEGECEGLARQHAPAEAAGYFARLVRAWLAAVYGGRRLDDTTVDALCRDFDRHLPRAARTVAAAPIAPAAPAA